MAQSGPSFLEETICIDMRPTKLVIVGPIAFSQSPLSVLQACFVILKPRIEYLHILVETVDAVGYVDERDPELCGSNSEGDEAERFGHWRCVGSGFKVS